MRIDCRIGLAAALLAISFVPAAACAASFDCARAVSATEKRICADPQLSSDDESVAVEYRGALAAAPLPFAVRDAQRRWIAEVRDKTTTNADLRTALVDRATQLNMQAKGDVAAALAVPLASIATHCTAARPDSGTCKVEASGSFPAAHLAWQRRVYTDGEMTTAAGVVAYAIEGATARPIVWHDEEDTGFEDPQLIASPAGTLLDLRGYLHGTGNYSAEVVLLQEAGAWRQVDTGAIDSGLVAHVPRGRAIWKGVYPDWRHMTVDSPLWKETDGNCCPTGGTVRGTLKRVGLRMLVERAVYDPRPLAE
ncbi:MAG: hypothetical protein JWM65_638 [Sphingomonas bacterium]|nr:hypothetical protein [Sphingomonas bacterium]